MKATKVTMTIKIEVLAPEVINSMLMKMQEVIRSQDVPAGMIAMDDGDCIEWTTVQTGVDI